jgi:hypothetical protein
MSSFLSGALGALTVLAAAGVARAAAWRRWRHHRHGPGRGGRIASHVARRIGAGPEAEKVLAAEADALASELSGLRADGAALRAELADLLAAPTLDADRARAALEARLARLGDVKARLAEALARVHAALGPAERERLAALVRSGPRGHHRHGHAHP